MRPNRIFLLTAFARIASCLQKRSLPRYPHDPRTTGDCLDWIDVEEGDTCEVTLRTFAIPPERFHAWNPSVGLDCKPWFPLTSYCILTNEVEDNAVWTATTVITEEGGMDYTMTLAGVTTNSVGWRIPLTKSDATLKPTSTFPAIPEPSLWVDSGCYVDDWSDRLVEGVYRKLPFQYSAQDEELTPDKCKQNCWNVEYKVAAVKDVACWCGDEKNSTRADDQGECNVPCKGDASQMCGGAKAMNMFEAGIPGEKSTTYASPSTPTESSAARRNVPMEGRFRWW